MKCKLTDAAGIDEEGKSRAGEIIEDDRAYRLVQLGKAEPADDECKQVIAQWRDARRRDAQELARRMRAEAAHKRKIAQAQRAQSAQKFADKLNE